jgi:hypothetical protein
METEFVNIFIQKQKDAISNLISQNIMLEARLGYTEAQLNTTTDQLNVANEQVKSLNEQITNAKRLNKPSDQTSKP